MGAILRRCRECSVHNTARRVGVTHSHPLTAHLADRSGNGGNCANEAIRCRVSPCPVNLPTQWWHRSCPGRAVVVQPPTRHTVRPSNP
jgi:hypothetical protein